MMYLFNEQFWCILSSCCCCQSSGTVCSWSECRSHFQWLCWFLEKTYQWITVTMG